MTLKEMRLAQGLTQRELADKCGVSVTCLCNWETGSAKPRPGKYKLLARELRVSPSAIVKAVYAEEVS